MIDQGYQNFKDVFISESPVDISEDKIRQLYAFMIEMKKTNAHVNLTRIVDDRDFIEKHLLDAVTCPLKAEAHEILDVGSGGGIPGVPLAICHPDKHFTLLDSTGKKMKAVEEIVNAIGLKNVSFLIGRAEDYGKKDQYREQFDGVCARAVAAFNVLDELCVPFLKVGGTFYAWKGQQAKAEIEEAGNGLSRLGLGSIRITQNLILKKAAFHVIIQCDKIGSTPKKYPRNYGRIIKKPLA